MSKPIIAQNTVFLNAAQDAAVLEGDPTARYLIVRKGQEISEVQAAKYTNSLALILGEQKELELEATDPEEVDLKPAKKKK